MNEHPSARFLSFVLFTITLARAGTSLAAGDVYDQFFRYTEREHKVLAQELPGETVDPFTGTLRVVQTDLVLPGKGGLDLKIVRTYSSKIWGRSDLLDMEPLLAEKEHSVLGYGWSFHFGRIKNPNAAGELGACGTVNLPVYEAADGTARTFYPSTGSSSVYVSRDYWRMEKNCGALSGAGTCIWSDKGIRYEFSSSNAYYYGGTIPVWPVSKIVDPFGNPISFTYLPQSGAVSSIADTYNRPIAFSYETVEDGYRLDRMTVNGNDYWYLYTTYTPTQTGGTGRYPLPGTGRKFLTEVRPPAGPSWFYQYAYSATVAANQYALSAITYPSGGTSSYTYSTSNFFTGNDTVPFAAVSQRVVAGRAVPSEQWTYAYTSPPAGTAMNVTTIGRPDGKHDVHTMYGLGYVAGKNAAGFTWMTGLTQQISRADGAETETLTWDPRSGAPISNSPFNAPVYSGTCGAYLWDNAVYSPALTQRSIARDGATYTTTYSSFDGYGQARTVVETGQLSRTTNWTFFSAPTTAGGATLNMVRGFPLTQHVCLGTTCTGATDTFDNGWTYNGPAYAKDSETITGVTTSFGYDSFGNLHTITDALSEVLTLSGYDVGKGVPTSIDFNGAFSHTRTTTWEGWIQTETDGRGNTTRYDYDAIGRMKIVTPPGTSAITTYTYATDGSSVTMTRGTYSKTTNVDGLGRTTSTSDSAGVLTSTRYDNMGRLWFKSYPYDTSIGEVGEAQTTIDGLGRPTAIKRAYRPATATCDVSTACTITNSYSNNAVTTTVQRASGDSATTTRTFKSFGDPGEQRLTAVTDANVKSWSYVYNVHGDLKTLTAPSPAGNRTYNYYGVTQFLKDETSGERGTTTYGRNAIGQITTKQDARAVVATYGYKDSAGNPDPLSRLRTVSYAAGGSPDDVTTTYDNANNLASLSSANGGSYAFGYDEINRPTTQSWTISGQTYTTTLHYDSSGCLDSMTYPTGTVVTMTCDSANRTTSIAIATSSIVGGVAYHPSGQVKQATYGNAASLSGTFDDRGRTKTATVAGVIDLSYGYDGADNVTSYNNAAVANVSRTMTYDKLDRLSTATAPYLWGTATYDYDDLGNRKLNSIGSYTASYSYDPATNRLIGASAGSFRDTNRTFNWDLPGRLAWSSDGTSYLYDGKGRRVQKTDGSGSTLYHYDAAGRLISETTPSGQKLRDYIYLGARLLAVDGCISNAPPNCTERQWYHTDALGSVLARTDGSGTVVGRFDYGPWGEQWTTPAVQGDRQYNGRVFDPATGFHDYGARMYWPQIARFVSADDVAPDVNNPATFNKYAYVHDNPYRYIDPTGRWASAAYPPFSQEVHQMAIQNVLGRLPSRGVQILQDQQSQMDKYQGADQQFLHAMWDHRGKMTRQEAIARANDFVVARLRTAQAQAKENNTWGFYHSLGDAIHTLQDATSPAHRDFQDYGGQTFFGHVNAEGKYPALGSVERAQLEAATRWAYDIAIGRATMPEEFFDAQTGRLQLPQKYQPK